MRRHMLGVALASAVMYVFGFIYWGLNPLPYNAWKATANDFAAGQALMEHFPENGTYMVPGPHNAPDQLSELYERGPVAFVHMLDRDGRPQVDTNVMALGMLLNLLVVLLLSIILDQISPALPTYGKRVRFIILAGIAASIMIDGGDVVWWHIPIFWKLYQAVYNIVSWTLVGLVLAHFVENDINDYPADATEF